MSSGADPADVLVRSLELPCGLVLRNRLIKAAMSDSLGDGVGGSTDAQARMYRMWAEGGAALSIIGEVQVDSRYPEKPGNLVLDQHADFASLPRLTSSVAGTGSHLWPQLGHAGAMSHPPISAPAGPSSLDAEGVPCAAMPNDEIEALPGLYGAAAQRARDLGFTGVEIHAGHGFLLSQFLSPLFNRRTDRWGGSIEARSRLLIDIVGRVRSDVGAEFAVGVKINATDELEGGLTEADSLTVIEQLGTRGVDLIDISGGTYFPGAPSSSDRPPSGPYYASAARRARTVTSAPIMVTGGVKTRADAIALIDSGAADAVGLARPLVLRPDLANEWIDGDGADPEFPRFDSSPPGGVTAWYTMRISALASLDKFDPETAGRALSAYDARDAERCVRWNARFGHGPR